MRRIMLLAAMIGCTAFLVAQTTATTTSTTTKETAKTTRHHRHHKMNTLGWKCHKHGEICQLDVEDIVAEQDSPAHAGCDPATAIYVSVSKGQSLLITKHDLKQADFTLTIEPDAKSKDNASPYPFVNMPPPTPVPSWWTGPATGNPDTCYHLHVTTTKGQSGDPHIMFGSD